jgi:hypothetical protein
VHLFTRILTYGATAALGALTAAGSVLGWADPHRAAIPHDHRPIAYLIARAAECDGSFDVLSIFDRAEVRAHVQFAGIFVVGPAADSALVDSIGHAHDLHVSVRRADAALTMRQRALGYHEAVLVVADGHDKVLLARRLPATPTEYSALAELLSDLTS